MKLDQLVDLAYIAGFLDGEGCIGLYVKRQKGFVSFNPFLSFTQVKTEVLEDIKTCFGSGKITPKPRSDPNQQPCSQLIFGVDEIEVVLNHLLPYLRIKRRQAECVLEFLNLPKQHDDENSHLIVAQKLAIATELMELNKRGR